MSDFIPSVTITTERYDELISKEKEFHKRIKESSKKYDDLYDELEKTRGKITFGYIDPRDLRQYGYGYEYVGNDETIARLTARLNELERKCESPPKNRYRFWEL